MTRREGKLRRRTRPTGGVFAVAEGGAAGECEVESFWEGSGGIGLRLGVLPPHPLKGERGQVAEIVGDRPIIPRRHLKGREHQLPPQVERQLTRL